MTVKRMDNLGIVVEGIDAAIEFFQIERLILRSSRNRKHMLDLISPAYQVAEAIVPAALGWSEKLCILDRRVPIFAGPTTDLY
jgi:hypothetical protein